jgi:hypothetical protein
LGERALRAILFALGATQVALFVWMIASPGTFFEAIAGFGGRNDHFIRDAAVFPLAIGAGLLVSVRRPSWRVPTLAIGAVWYLAHAVNHLIDIGDSEPGWVGPFDFVALLATGLLLLWLALVCARADIRAAR